MKKAVLRAVFEQRHRDMFVMISQVLVGEKNEVYLLKVPFVHSGAFAHRCPKESRDSNWLV